MLINEAARERQSWYIVSKNGTPHRFFDFQLYRYVISVWNELGSYSFQQALSASTRSTISFLENADMSQSYTARGRQTLKKIQIYKLLIDFFDFQLYVISDW